jgi:hypothetical protein
MSKRLQVLFEEGEFRELQRIAKLHRMTLAEWVRQALRDARGREPRGDSRKKLEVIRAAALHEFPTGEVEQILREIEKGYTGGEIS